MICARCCKKVIGLATANGSQPQRLLRRYAADYTPSIVIITDQSSTLFTTSIQARTPSLSTTSPLQSLITQRSRPSILSSSTTLPAAFQIPPQQRSDFSTTAANLAPRNTYNPSRRVQKRRHGFLARQKTKNGLKVLKRRMLKGRKWLSW